VGMRLPKGAHDPYPDGKSGPWLRKPHKRDYRGLKLLYDPRCRTCTGDQKPAMACPSGLCRVHPWLEPGTFLAGQVLQGRRIT
jgi:hypothetical protein